MSSDLDGRRTDEFYLHIYLVDFTSCFACVWFTPVISIITLTGVCVLAGIIVIGFLHKYYGLPEPRCRAAGLGGVKIFLCSKKIFEPM